MSTHQILVHIVRDGTLEEFDQEDHFLFSFLQYKDLLL